MDTEPAVAIEDLSKQFGTGANAVTAVEDVSLTVESGSVVGLLGPNGAGKTTLIKCILGTVLPDSGTVSIHGIDVNDRPRAAYKHVDATLEGARNDYWRLTVRENLRYFATINGVDPDGVAGRHDRLLNRLDLAEKADVPVRKLSRGMKQKVSLASALAGNASVVFLDEPTLGLDVESTRVFQDELRRVAEREDRTVVLSSHDMGVVEAVCDRVVIMAGGRIRADDSVDSLLAEDAHTLELTSPDFTDDRRARLRRQFDVRHVETHPSGTRIEVRVTDADLYRLMRYLEAETVRLERVRTVESDLEDLLLSLTAEGTA